MRVGLASDSLGDIAALCRAFRFLIESQKCDRLFFLGGNWADVDTYNDATAETPLPGSVPAVDPGSITSQDAPRPPEPVVRVCERGGATEEDHKVIEMFGNQLCILVHNKADLTKEDISNAPLILHGKSPKAALVRIGSRTFITPGSVSGSSPSVAVLDQQGQNLDVRFYDLDGRILQSEVVGMGGGSKMMVR